MRLTATILAGALVVGTLAAPAPNMRVRPFSAEEKARLDAKFAAWKAAKDAGNHEKGEAVINGAAIGVVGRVGPVISKGEAHKASKNEKRFITVASTAGALEEAAEKEKAHKAPKNEKSYGVGATSGSLAVAAPKEAAEKEKVHKAPRNEKIYGAIIGGLAAPKEVANRGPDGSTKAYKGPKADRFQEIVTKLPGKIYALSQKGVKKLLGLHRNATEQMEDARSKVKTLNRSERSQKSETSTKPKKGSFLYSDVAAPELTRPSLNKVADKPENKPENKHANKVENKSKRKLGFPHRGKNRHENKHESSHESNREDSRENDRKNNDKHNHEHKRQDKPENNLESEPEINHETKPDNKHGGRFEIRVKPTDVEARVKELTEELEEIVANAEKQEDKRALGDGKPEGHPPSSTITNLDHEAVDRMFRTPEESTERHHLKPKHGADRW